MPDKVYCSDEKSVAKKRYQMRFSTIYLIIVRSYTSKMILTVKIASRPIRGGVKVINCGERHRKTAHTTD